MTFKDGQLPPSRTDELQDIAQRARLLPTHPPAWLHEQWADELASWVTIMEAADALLGQYVDQFPSYPDSRALRLSVARGPVTPASTMLEATAYAQTSREALHRARIALGSARTNLGRLAPIEPAPAEAPLTVVPHDVDACRYCANPKIREAVLLVRFALSAGDDISDGWQCSKCGWATVDLGTMHEQLWPSVTNMSTPAVDMVCPGCGAIGVFVDYPREATGD